MTYMPCPAKIADSVISSIRTDPSSNVVLFPIPILAFPPNHFLGPNLFLESTVDRTLFLEENDKSAAFSKNTY